MQPRPGQQPESVKGRIPVDPLPYRLYRKQLRQTIKEQLILDKKKARWTKDPEIMDRMYDRHPHPACSDKDRGRSPKEPVVHMNDIRPEPADSLDGLDKRDRIEEKDEELQRGMTLVVE